MTAPADLPLLKFTGALWTFREYPTPGEEWSLDRKLAEIRRQGFEAVGAWIIPEVPALCEKHGLECIAYIDADGTTYRDQLHRVLDMKPVRVNVQLCDHDTPPAEAARVWIEMVELARQLGLVIDLELHRDTATEVPEKAYAIAEIYREKTGLIIRFCPDFSHFNVVKQISPPYAPRLLDRPDLIAPVRQVHARPFNRSHAQIPATDGAGNLVPEFIPWLEFMDEMLAMMLRTAGPKDVFYICPEFGPLNSGYNLTAFPDPWNDEVRTRDEIRALWNKRLAPQRDRA